MIPGPDGPNTGPPLVFQGAISIQGSKILPFHLTVPTGHQLQDLRSRNLKSALPELSDSAPTLVEIAR